jgi:hypothetical protein
MGRTSGMNAEQVDAFAGTLDGRIAPLSSFAAETSRAVTLSQRPASPGESVIAPASLGLARSASAELRAAVADAETLIARLAAEVAAQRAASGAQGGVATSVVTSRPGSLDSDDPDEVERYWNSLTDAERAELIKNDSLRIGNLDGIPLHDRIAANAETARERAKDTSLSKKEREYLDAVANGDRKLVIFDPANQRIVEMIGDFDENTERVITYVPGTGADEAAFHYAQTQQVGAYLVEADPDDRTVAFIVKDGQWADWGYFQGSANNDRDFTDGVGTKIADFQNVILREPDLTNTEQIGIAHSWGMSALSSSETHGAHYDKVFSLSGAWLAPDWKPDADTDYFHLQYGVDAINYAEIEGDYPHENSNFTKTTLAPNTFEVLGIEFQDEAANHGRSSQGEAQNQDLLIKVRHEIYG